MIKLTFKCTKCKKEEIIKNPPSDQQQPFCMECCMPMFLVKSEVNS